MRVELYETKHMTVLQPMIRHSVVESTNKFNVFPVKQRDSDHHSPQTLVTRQIFDWKRHYKFEFGECVQADTHQDPRNDMRGQMSDTVYFCPRDSGQGEHALVDLATGRETTKNGVTTAMPLMKSVKNTAETMTISQKIAKLKFTKKSRETLSHKDLIAGVDCDVIKGGNDSVNSEESDNDVDRESFFGNDDENENDTEGRELVEEKKKLRTKLNGKELLVRKTRIQKKRQMTKR